MLKQGIERRDDPEFRRVVSGPYAALPPVRSARIRRSRADLEAAGLTQDRTRHGGAERIGGRSFAVRELGEPLAGDRSCRRPRDPRPMTLARTKLSADAECPRALVLERCCRFRRIAPARSSGPHRTWAPLLACSRPARFWRARILLGFAPRVTVPEVCSHEPEVARGEEGQEARVRSRSIAPRKAPVERGSCRDHQPRRCSRGEVSKQHRRC